MQTGAVEDSRLKVFRQWVKPNEQSVPSFKRLAAAATGSAIAARVISAFAGFVVVGLLTRSLGSAGYGRYALVTSAAGFLSFMDQGLAVGVRTLVARWPGQSISPRSSVNAGVGLIKRVAWPLSLLMLTTAVIVHSTSLNNATVEYFLLYESILLLGMPFVAYCRGLEGLNKTHITVLLMTTGSFSVLCTTVIGIAFRLTLPFYILTAALLTSVPYVLARRTFKRVAPVDVAAADVSRSDVWKLSWPMAIVSIMLSFSYSLDPVVIAQHLGDAANAEYSVVSKLSQMAMLITTASFPVLWAHNTQRKADNRTTLAKESAFFTVLGVISGIGLFIGCSLFIGSWTDGKIHVSASLIAAFGCWGVILSTHLPASSRLTDERGLRFQAKTTTCMSLLNIPLSIWLVCSVGVSGPVWASAIALLLCHAIPIYIKANKQIASSVAHKSVKLYD